MDNSPKQVLFNIVSGQTASNALWKQGEVFLIQNLTVFLFLRAVVNISIQTLVIFRQMIISHLELGSHVMRLEQKHYQFAFFWPSDLITLLGNTMTLALHILFCSSIVQKGSHRIKSKIFK